MPELTSPDRLRALLEWGDVGEADAAIDEAEASGGGWQPSLWRGMRALTEGRFHRCEGYAAEAAARGFAAAQPVAGILGGLLLVALRREQEHGAEAEGMLRSLLADRPTVPSDGPALLALLLAEMGRDAQARLELARLLPVEPVAVTGHLGALWLLAETAAAAGAPDGDLALLYRRLLPHTGDFAVEEGGAVFYGSVAYVLGRLAQGRGRRDTAIGHFDEALAAHQAAGAPLLVAHTQRRLATLLRTRGFDGDWERAEDLLARAGSIYRHLGVDGLAAETQVVLARSEEPVGDDREPPTLRRRGDGWVVGRGDDLAQLDDAPGIRDLARLLAVPRTALHAVDLLTNADGAKRHFPTAGPATRAAFQPWIVEEPILDEPTRAEYAGRLDELAGELVDAEEAGDRVRVALAWAERDELTAALAGEDGGDDFERARRAVCTRIRISIDRVEAASPVIGRHLRTSVRTGTFCSYQPELPVQWQLEPASE